MSKIIPAADAIDLVQDGDVVAVSGYGTNGVPELALATLESRFKESGTPRDLTLLFAGGIGDGKDRGLNRLGHPGLLKRVVGGHYGLIPKIEQLARDDEIEAYNFPEGVITTLYRNIAAGKPGALSRVGLETFVDPRLEGAKVNEAARCDGAETSLDRESGRRAFLRCGKRRERGEDRGPDHLHVDREGKYAKFVDAVGQVTFSGVRAGREGRAGTYVTERCVFSLHEGGLELTEVAPGIDVEKDILSRLPFSPTVFHPREMDPALFRPDPMGLLDRIGDVDVENRISYNAQTNTLFLDYSGMRVEKREDLDRIKVAVDATLEPLGRRVVAVVNYDSFWVAPHLADEYLDLVRYVEARYYLKVSRYTTNGFMRIKLSRGLAARKVTSDVVQNWVQATDQLKDD